MAFFICVNTRNKYNKMLNFHTGIIREYQDIVSFFFLYAFGHFCGYVEYLIKSVLFVKKNIFLCKIK